MDEREVIKEVMRIVGQERCLDDCAVILFRGGCIVATTDMLHESADFPAGMSEWQIGWMSVAVTLSDIAGMGAAPAAVMLAVGLDAWERITGIMSGAKECCDRFGAELVGGDIDHHDELTLVSSGLGVVAPENLVRRRGAQVGDLICITGVPGRAQAALEGYRQYEEYLFEPVPRVTEGQILAGAGVTSMMDISDGLALSLYDMLEANTCGYRIRLADIPLLDDVPTTEARDLALYGGGDFELLFTCPPDRLNIDGVGYCVIGTVIKERSVLIDDRVLERRGYQHQW